MSTAKRKGLGRGLESLLGGRNPAQPFGEGLASASAKDHIQSIAIAQIERGRYQPRRDFDPERLHELAESINAQGVIQPIVVRPLEGNGEGYEIIAGERRWRAAQQAGLHEIPAVVRNVDEQTSLAIALVENIQRDDLNPLEEATALQRLQQEFGLTHQEVALAVGKSRTTVTNLLRLLELETEAMALLDRGGLEMGHARALLGLKGDQQVTTARLVASRGLSVRETEREVRRIQQQREEETEAQPKSLDPNIRRLQDDLCDRLGASVAIQHGGRGAGKLVIKYNSLDELDGILAHIQ